jgi:DNA-binding MarR family transcriptional regulator/GNAT superfamily N-acetyltransferase
MDRQQIADVRRFNRAVTQRIGVLEDGYLNRGRPLGEARLLFEIGPGGGDVQELRARLRLDSGYASRLLRSLEAQGLVALGRDEEDGRRRRATLTEAGLIEYEAYDTLSDDLAGSLLQPLGETQRARLVKAMEEIERLLGAGSIELLIEPSDGADARWCLGQYFAELAERFEEGFDTALGVSPSEASVQPPDGAFIVARLHGAPVGCGMLRLNGDRTGEIKRMWISRRMRGVGLASRILARLEQIAREFGWTRVQLDTNRALTNAQAMYRKAGYRDIERYNDNPYADFWFEKDL